MGKYILISFFILALMSSCDSPIAKEKGSDSQDSLKIEQSKKDNSTAMSTEDKVDELIATDTVLISGMKFNPEELHVQKGATVIWINKGIVPHDVTAFPDRIWTSDTIKVGESWKKTIDESFDYFCGIHITMKGKVIVDK